MNLFDVDVKALGEDLEKEGLTPQEARTTLTQAFNFFVAVRTNQLAGRMLPDATIWKKRDLTTKVAAWIAKYRKSGMPGIAAEVYRLAIPAGIDSIAVILTCEEICALGIVKEWTFLGFETRQWRETHVIPGAPEQKIYIHKDVLNAGIHIFDFRKGRDGKLRGNRHFLPSNWHNREQVELCYRLAEAAEAAKAAYDAAHGKKTAVREALEKAGVVPEVRKLEAPTPVEIPVAPGLPTVEESNTAEQTTTQNPPVTELRFVEDIPEADGKRGDRKNERKGRQARGRRHDDLEDENNYN